MASIRTGQLKLDSVIAYDSHPSFTLGTELVDKQYVDDEISIRDFWSRTTVPSPVLFPKNSGDTVRVTAADPVAFADSQIKAKGSSLIGAGNTGGSITLEGNNGSTDQVWARLFGYKVNSVGGDNTAALDINVNSNTGDVVAATFNSAGISTLDLTATTVKFRSTAFTNSLSTAALSASRTISLLDDDGTIPLLEHDNLWVGFNTFTQNVVINSPSYLEVSRIQGPVTGLTIADAGATGITVKSDSGLPRIGINETLPLAYFQISGNSSDNAFRLAIKDNSAATDEKIWSITNQAGVFKLVANNDGITSSNDAISIIRDELDVIDTTITGFVRLITGPLKLGSTGNSGVLDIVDTSNVSQTKFDTETESYINASDGKYLGIGTDSPNTTLAVNGSMSFEANVVTTDYNPSALTTDYQVSFSNTASPRTYTLSTEDIQAGSLTQPRWFVVSDKSGAASVNNITITAESGSVFGKNVITTNYGSAVVYTDGTNVYSSLVGENFWERVTSPNAALKPRFVGDWVTVPAVQYESGAFVNRLSSPTLTEDRNITLPDASGEIPLIESNNTWTGDNSFPSIKLRNGSFTTTLSAPTITTNRIATIPDESGTIALLERANTWTATNTFSNVRVGGATSNTTLAVNGSRSEKCILTATNYNPSALTTDYHIAFTNTSAVRTCTISTEDIQSGTTSHPRWFVVSDKSGGAGTNNITITAESGSVFGDNLINRNYGAALVYADGTNIYCTVIDAGSGATYVKAFHTTSFNGAWGPSANGRTFTLTKIGEIVHCHIPEVLDTTVASSNISIVNPIPATFRPHITSGSTVTSVPMSVPVFDSGAVARGTAFVYQNGDLEIYLADTSNFTNGVTSGFYNITLTWYGPIAS